MSDYDGYDDYDEFPDDEPSGRGPAFFLIGVLALILFCCTCCCGFAFWGFGMFTQQAGVAVGENTVVKEHLGDVTKVKFNWEQSLNQTNDDTFVFDVTGTQGSGTVTATFETASDTVEEITAGTLKLDSGESYDLLPVEDGD